jgi:hypothetical protein
VVTRTASSRRGDTIDVSPGAWDAYEDPGRTMPPAPPPVLYPPPSRAGPAQSAPAAYHGGPYSGPPAVPAPVAAPAPTAGAASSSIPAVAYPPPRTVAWEGEARPAEQPRVAIVPPAQRPRIEGVTVGADQIMRERRARVSDPQATLPPAPSASPASPASPDK